MECTNLRNIIKEIVIKKYLYIEFQIIKFIYLNKKGIFITLINNNKIRPMLQ